MITDPKSISMYRTKLSLRDKKTYDKADFIKRLFRESEKCMAGHLKNRKADLNLAGSRQEGQNYGELIGRAEDALAAPTAGTAIGGIRVKGQNIADVNAE